MINRPFLRQRRQLPGELGMISPLFITILGDWTITSHITHTFSVDIQVRGKQR